MNDDDEEGNTAFHFAAALGTYPDDDDSSLESTTSESESFEDGEDETFNELRIAEYDKCIEALLNTEGINVNVQNNVGCTPLHYAAWSGDQDCVKMLVKVRNININVGCKDQNHQEYTALHFAAEAGNVGVLKVLLKLKRLNPNAQTADGNTALMLAAKNKHFDCAILLIENENADLTIKNKYGQNVLHWAVYKGMSKLVHKLLEYDVINVNAQTKLGFTALHIAAGNHYLSCTKALLNDSDIDIMIRDGKGKTPLDRAQESDTNPEHKNEIIHLLRSYIDSNVNVLRHRRVRVTTRSPYYS